MKTLNLTKTLKSAAAGLLSLSLAAGPALAHKKTPKRRASVEVVFAIDTTGSMGGLIAGAKEKVWAIANEIAKGVPAPKIKMGLIAYRDRGDKYVTKVFDLTSNLDKMYENLLALEAGGGGDGPEHVLAALSDSVEKISWASDPKTFKVLYLVGDAPAHLDYPNTPKLEELTQKIVRKGVVLNTVQCGGNSATTAQWRQLARLGEGKFLPIPHSGGVVAAATPFDERIAELNRRMEGTRIAFGAKKREARERMALASRVARMASPSAAADRAVFKAKAGFEAEYDLAEAVVTGEVRLEEMKEKDLPAEFKGLSKAQRQMKLDKIKGERKQLRGKIVELSKKRSDFLKKNAGEGKRDSFDAKLVDSLKAQASKAGIKY